MEIKQYAPICIPTLNRYEHFKRCLESLERCVWADKTDVYVGLDYPPCEKYREGWERIDEFLHEKEACNGFKNLFVRRRDHNCGVGVAGGNSSLLLQEVKASYDTYIFSEDDNEFSQNFLVYMNKGLCKFSEDDRVYCICGYNRRIELPESFTGNCYLAHDFVAWGVGYWTSRQRPPEYRSFDYLKSLLRDKEKYNILKEKSPGSIRDIVTMLKLQKYHGDVIVDTFEAIEGKYSVMPTVSKVRNHGNDGTGLHSKSVVSELYEYYSEQPIDKELDFDFADILQMQPKGIVVASPGNVLPSWKKIIKYMIFKFDLFLIRNFGVVSHSKYI